VEPGAGAEEDDEQDEQRERRRDGEQEARDRG
jgi:hypothetical protein